ncbi:bifunctional diguanylate cyclase/phosphodiesterase [Thioalkalivibrio sp. ALJ24]|uniref:putative bifunctional diguanylate cyclase/phosphodiesterase n=1 Tax=Thioalkalivibrio sp. ALJ24 TaxID=545276 RepID=UPI00047699FF|nr:EAL domain-containing protein [Thioalkalivibrio sp. ALJ24]
MPDLLEYHDFVRSLGEFPARARETGARMAMVVVELEGLADVDVAFGYTVADALLRRAGKALNARIPDGLTGVTGRHQLACFLPEAGGSGFAELAAHKVLRVLSEPFACEGRQILLWPRVGLGLAAESMPPDQLLSRAFAAVREARRARASLRRYTTDASTEMLEGVDLWSRLSEAIEDGQLYLEYQPQVGMSTGRVVSAEALLRWNHPRYGPVRPDTMVGVAEGTDLMPRLTHWVFNTALRQCAEYRQVGADLGVSVNFSAGDLKEDELVELVGQSLDVWGVPPDRVTVELTETAVMESDTEARKALRRMKDLGLRVAMDDFGTGYSSMERLLRMPLDELKIDRTFIRELVSSPSHQRIVESMVMLGHNLDLMLVAEGVEDDGTLEHLRALGCDLLQGFHPGLGRPVSLADFKARVLKETGSAPG